MEKVNINGNFMLRADVDPVVTKIAYSQAKTLYDISYNNISMEFLSIDSKIKVHKWNYDSEKRKMDLNIISKSTFKGPPRITGKINNMLIRKEYTFNNIYTYNTDSFYIDINTLTLNLLSSLSERKSISVFYLE